MVSREILIDELDGRLAAALVENGKVQNLYVDPAGDEPLPGAIYLAEVARIDTGLNAAFLNLGNGREGFLKEQDLQLPGNKSHTIGELQTGAKIVVQVKGAADAVDGKRILVTMKVQYLNEGDAKKMDMTGPPHRLHPGLNAALRMLKDYTNDNVKIIDIKEKYADEIMAFCTAYAEGATINKSPDDLFDARDVYGELARLSQNEIEVKGGGNILIEPTRALTIIDVNSSSNSNPLDANIEAAREIARQIRLRNLSGIIVIDFIKMTGKGDRGKVEDALKEACALDRIQYDLHGFTRLGLYELTRART